MQENDGVLAAIQALAGVYIHDYMPMTRVCRKVNECFQAAESRLTELINYPTELDGNLSDELITIATLLSMEDVSYDHECRIPLFCPSSGGRSNSSLDYSHRASSEEAALSSMADWIFTS